jgi:hypothetical protein
VPKSTVRQLKSIAGGFVHASSIFKESGAPRKYVARWKPGG